MKGRRSVARNEKIGGGMVRLDRDVISASLIKVAHSFCRHYDCSQTEGITKKILIYTVFV